MEKKDCEQELDCRNHYQTKFLPLIHPISMSKCKKMKVVKIKKELWEEQGENIMENICLCISLLF